MKWISVDDRLPCHNQEIVVLFKGNNGGWRVSSAVMFKDDKFVKGYRYGSATVFCDSQVQYWMPLELPKDLHEQT